MAWRISTFLTPGMRLTAPRPRSRVQASARRGVAGQAVEVEILDRQRHAVARVQLVQAPAHVRASGDRHELEVGVAPQQVCGEGARKACRARHDHPRRSRRVRL